MLHLIIANKNYSSWSARPWLLMTELDIPFQELQIKFNSKEWVDQLPKYSPTRMVPVLWEGQPITGTCTFDSIAIIERLVELFPTKPVLPKDPRARTSARSLMATFHSGFHALRAAMPMNIRANYSGFGHTVEALKDISRLTQLIKEAKE